MDRVVSAGCGSSGVVVCGTLEPVGPNLEDSCHQMCLSIKDLIGR